MIHGLTRKLWLLTGALLGLGLLTLAGCSKDATAPPRPLPKDPETLLTLAPIDFDTTSFRVHFYWNGYDSDGEVVRFRYAVDADTVLPIPQWRTTTAKDTTFLFLVDPVKEIRAHVFKVTAEDNTGRYDPTPAVRFFSAKTLPPTSRILKGPVATNPLIGPNFSYEWEGTDPDGGETGGRAPVDSFEYLLLQLRTVADTLSPPPPHHLPLPPYSQATYVDLVNRATGDTLPFPHGDWRWQGVRALKHRFLNVSPGEYVFALRAVDIAGARQKGLGFGDNITHFTVTAANPGPSLSINSNLLNAPLPSTSGPVDFPRRQLQLFAGESISFSWSADASLYGGDIIGYTYALDDTSSYPGLDVATTSATFTPAQLTVSGDFPTPHFLYVRAVDDGGLVTNAQIPILIIPPRFKKPGTPREILFVDDSLSPSGDLSGSGSFPSDAVEDAWYTLGEPGRPKMLPRIAETYGIPFTQWDTYKISINSSEGRKAPEPRDLANYTTVVWISDTNNHVGAETALWKTLVGGSYSELGGYLRAGGTMILSGYEICYNSTDPFTTMYANISTGICQGLLPLSSAYNLSFFPRAMMGIDGAIPNQQGRRFLGAKDFVEGVATPAGAAMGFQSARVDTGDGASGAKWVTGIGTSSSETLMDVLYAPGLPRIEGWTMARDFLCQPEQELIHVEPGVAGGISEPIYRYHGVPLGLHEDMGPSPREGMVVAVRVKSHDLGITPGGPYNPAAAIGRIVILGFPLYFVEDQAASDILFNAFTWVNESPTLTPVP